MTSVSLLEASGLAYRSMQHHLDQAAISLDEARQLHRTDSILGCLLYLERNLGQALSLCQAVAALHQCLRDANADQV